MKATLGTLIRSFFEDHLTVQKGLRPGSIRSYRDTLRLFLCFLTTQTKQPITRLSVEDLTLDSVLAFLKHIEEDRGNHARTRNQRRAALTTFFRYLALRTPEMLDTCQQIAAIPVKRTPLPPTHHLEPQEVTAVLKQMPRGNRFALRDRALLLFLYNTGARVQEAADLRIEHLDLKPPARVQLHGKGDKWRPCPLWNNTVDALKQLLAERPEAAPTEPVFCAARRRPLTRFGLYKIVRRHAAGWDKNGADPRRVTPHLFRHTAAVHMLESGIEVNVIRGWLGHVSLDTTNRYAEITLRAKQEAMRTCEPHCNTSGGSQRQTVWKDDKTLLDWLNSL